MKPAICRTCVLGDYGCGGRRRKFCSVREVKEGMAGVLIIADERKT
jgi:hypothetical protein